MSRERASVGFAMLGAALTAVLTLSASADEDLTQRVARLEQQMETRQPEGPEAGGIQLTGYGEVHYNNLSGSGGASNKEEVDLHRFVFGFLHDFNERIRFRSEVEIEHGVTGGDEPGEVEVEQAYVEADVRDGLVARGGILLLPLGFLNEAHEPPYFYGVERNPVETRIIPTTWWEPGAGLQGEIGGGWRYDLVVHAGLLTSTSTAYAVRDGRQKGAEARASDPAATAALNWSAPGLLVGGAAQYQSDVTQGEDPDAGAALFGEVHGEVRRGPAALRALYAEWSLDGEGPDRAGADRQYGWYVEPSWKCCDAVGFFGRYSQWDNRAGSDEADSGKTQYEAGVNWWLHEQVVVKANYQWQDNDDGKDQRGVNLGLGYAF